MQRAELLAELERLAGEAAAARGRLAEIQNRIKLLREQIGLGGEDAEHQLKLVKEGP
jgi:hypothetical protein